MPIPLCRFRSVFCTAKILLVELIMSNLVVTRCHQGHLAVASFEISGWGHSDMAYRALIFVLSMALAAPCFCLSTTWLERPTKPRRKIREPRARTRAANQTAQGARMAKRATEPAGVVNFTRTLLRGIKMENAFLRRNSATELSQPLT